MYEQFLKAPDYDNSFYIPEARYDLDDNIIFVFGSNLAGRHGKGAAKHALIKYGAQYGQGVGLAGRSYAIPTKSEKIITLPLNIIRQYVDIFREHTYNSQDYFFVTPIGTGLAGYLDSQIAPMFKGVKKCWLPSSWEMYVKG